MPTDVEVEDLSFATVTHTNGSISRIHQAPLTSLKGSHLLVIRVFAARPLVVGSCGARLFVAGLLVVGLLVAGAFVVSLLVSRLRGDKLLLKTTRHFPDFVILLELPLDPRPDLVDLLSVFLAQIFRRLSLELLEQRQKLFGVFRVHEFVNLGADFVDGLVGVGHFEFVKKHLQV